MISWSRITTVWTYGSRVFMVAMLGYFLAFISIAEEFRAMAGVVYGPALFIIPLALGWHLGRMVSLVVGRLRGNAIFQFEIPFGHIVRAIFPFASRLLIMALLVYLIYEFAVLAPYVFQTADSIYISTNSPFIKYSVAPTFAMMMMSLIVGVLWQAGGLGYRTILAGYRFVKARCGSSRRVATV